MPLDQPHELVTVHQVAFQGTDLKEFAQQAAQRLTATVQATDLSPAQIREAAQQLAGEAERRINLNIITAERLSRDVQSARQGQTQGLERMFQEVSHPTTVQLMQRAMHSLESQTRDPQPLYLTATQVGQQYEGHLELKNSRACVVADSEGRHLVTNPSSLRQAITLEDGRVQFTAQDGQSQQMQMEY